MSWRNQSLSADVKSSPTQELIFLINPSNQQEAITYGMTQLRKLLADPDSKKVEEVAKQLMQENILPAITHFVEVTSRGAPSHSNPQFEPYMKLFIECIWVLTNLCSSSSPACTMIMDDQKLLQAIVSIAASSLSNLPPASLKIALELRAQLVWLLGNIAGDSASCRDRIFDFPPILETFLTPLVHHPENPVYVSYNRNAAWFASNLLRPSAGEGPMMTKSFPPLDKASEIIRVLAPLLCNQNVDEEVRADIMWALAYCAQNLRGGLDFVVGNGVVNMVVEQFAGNGTANISKPMVLPMLRIIGELASSADPKFATVFENAKLLAIVVSFASSETRAIQKEACWILSNIAAGSAAQTLSLVNLGVIPVLVRVLTSSTALEVKFEATFAIANLCTTAADPNVPQLMDLLVSADAVTALAGNLKTFAHVKLLTISMEALELIFKEFLKRSGAAGTKGAELKKILDVFQSCGGIDSLEKLQGHESHEVYKYAMKLLEEFFEDVNEEEQ